MQKKKKEKCLHFLFILRSLIMNTNFKLVKYTLTRMEMNYPIMLPFLIKENVKVEFDFEEI